MISEEYQQYRQAWESYPKECYVSQFPLHLDIELTTRCNLSCDMCPFHSENAPFKPEEEVDMDFKLYKKIIDEGSKKGLKSIKLNYRGEPLLYKQLPEAIRYAKKKGIIDVQLNTNATLLTSNLAKELVNSGLDLLIITDYNFNLQLKNARYFNKLKNGRAKPKVRVQTEFPMRWVWFVDEAVKPIYYDYHCIEEVFDKSDFKCSFPFLRLLILANGMIMKCSCGTVYPEKYLGFVQDWDIESYWHHKQMKFLRTCHEDRSSELVRICRVCPMRNEYIRGKK